MVATAHLSGVEAAVKAYQGEVSRLEQELARGLYEEAQLVMTDSKANYCPVGQPPEDTTPGTLRNSGFVDKPEWSGSTVTVRIGYGGAAESYALVQHERLDYHHTVGQAKYLERPTLAAAEGIDRRIADRINRASTATTTTQEGAA